MGESAVLLITMPWDSLWYPSIQIGTLKAVLAREGVSVQARSYNLAFAEHLTRSGFSAADYTRVVEEHSGCGLGDWLFAVPPFRENTPESDRRYTDYLWRSHDEKSERPFLERMLPVRQLVPEFLEQCATDILAAAPRVVGFSSTFSQNVASLCLASMLKKRAPSLRVVMGGANCDGPMGLALFRSFPWVDAVVRGEGERVLVRLVRDWLSEQPVQEQPGLCFRDQSGDHLAQSVSAPVPMDDVPSPDYDEYFERLRRSPLQADIQPGVQIPFESARGCWWGEKSHCTFCGLNGSTMKYRSKTPEKAFEQLLGLARKHRQLKLQAVDNIIEMGYFETLLPWLRDSGFDIKVFFETKSNLKKSQVQMLKDAGVRSIQPGIESLSTPILRLMKKGVTALQNVRLLKWCTEMGVSPIWNIIYGFPREPLDEYDRMAELIPALFHFPPPQLVPLVVQRFSPYHVRPAELGIELTGPAEFYAHIYPIGEEQLEGIAYNFAFQYLDGPPDRSRYAPIRQAVDRWRESSGRRLEYCSGPGFLQIRDDRTRGRIHELSGREAEIYLACEAGATPRQISNLMRERGDDDLSVEDIREFLEELSANGLIYREGDLFLSLAVRRQDSLQPSFGPTAQAVA